MDQIKNKVIKNTKRIEIVANQTFNHAYNISLYAAKEISKIDHNNLEKIHSIFVNVAQTQNVKDSSICWTFLDWLDRGNRQLVNTVTGINKNPPNMAKFGRKYSWKMVKDPWKLKFSTPTLGIPSNEYTIPAGLWIEKNGNYIGAVALGISINKFNNKIMAQIDEAIDYMVINKNDYNPVFKSEISASKMRTKDLKEYKNWAGISSKKRVLPNSGLLEEPVIAENSKYIYAQELKEDYPYIVLVGYDKNSLLKESIRKSLIIFAQFFTISWILTVILKRRSIR